jgi:hypothetical protein
MLTFCGASDFGAFFPPLLDEATRAHLKFVQDFDQGLGPGMEMPLLNRICTSDLVRKQALAQVDDTNLNFIS